MPTVGDTRIANQAMETFDGSQWIRVGYVDRRPHDPPRTAVADRCNVCGLRDTWNWDKLEICCSVHDRVICQDCMLDWLDEGEPPEPDEECVVRWDRVDAPPTEECIAELRRWMPEAA